MEIKFINKLLSFIGYYKIKASVKKKIHEKRIKKRDLQKINSLKQYINGINKRILPPIKTQNNIIVSLTSYGKRVEENAPFAIASILKQSLLPNKIVVNLDEKKWNEENLPILLQKLQIAGLEIFFCEDIGPHTKLLPTLANSPDDIIITVDDDILYEDNLIADLISNYNNSDKKTIICREAKVIEIIGEEFVTYSKSKDSEPGTTAIGYIPYGFRGVLYPPHVFSTDDIFNPIFREICRNADDIWFGLTEYKEQIKICCIKSQRMTLNFVNTVEQFNPTSDTCLYYENSIMGKNDIQFKAVLEYYKL